MLPALEGEKPEDRDNRRFGTLGSRRLQRDLVRQLFIDKAKRTSGRKRRWFRIMDIEPDEASRAKLLEHWRASIWSGDLMLRNESQVLCLSASPLMENNRLPAELARGEHFYMIVDDLWMSAPRWLQWFGQLEIEPPEWMKVRDWLKWFHQQGKPLPKWLASLQAGPEAIVTAPPPPETFPSPDPFSSATTSLQATRDAENYWPLPDNPPKQKAAAHAYKALLLMYPDRRIPKHISGQQLANSASSTSKKLVDGPSVISREAILRAMNRRS